MNMEEKMMMTKEQMKSELKSMKIKAIISKILILCAVAMSIFMAITGDGLIALGLLIIALVLGIKKILANKRNGEIRKLLENVMTKEEMESELKFMRIKVTIYRILTHGSLAAIIISLIITENILIAMCFLISAVVFGRPAGRAIRKRNENHKLLGDRVIREVIREVLGDDVEYNPEEALKPGDVLVPFYYEHSDGWHHIKTAYKGVNIELGNIILYIEEEDNEYGKHVHVRFKGPWIICDFGKKPAHNVYISERTKKDSMQSNVKIDNEQFDSRFCVRTIDSQDAYNILTPQMMESISAASDKSGGTVYISFLTDGKMHVGIQTWHNLFELGKCYDAEGLRQKFLEELRRLTDIIDTLNV